MGEAVGLRAIFKLISKHFALECILILQFDDFKKYLVNISIFEHEKE